MSTTALKKPKQSGKCKTSVEEAMLHHLDREHELRCSIFDCGVSTGATIEGGAYCTILGLMFLCTILSDLVKMASLPTWLNFLLFVTLIGGITLVPHIAEKKKKEYKEAEHKKLAGLRDELKKTWREKE